MDSSQDFSANFGDALFGDSLRLGSLGCKVLMSGSYPSKRLLRKGTLCMSATLMNLINKSYINHCDIGIFAEKYKVPENC